MDLVDWRTVLSNVRAEIGVRVVNCMELITLATCHCAVSSVIMFSHSHSPLDERDPAALIMLTYMHSVLQLDQNIVFLCMAS